MPGIGGGFHRKTGMPPGTVIYLGERAAEGVRMTLIRFDEERFEEREIASIDEALPFPDDRSVSWINIDGLHDTALIERIGELLGVHSLVLEDIVSTRQRPKLEDHESYLYVVLRMLSPAARTGEIDSEQISLLVGPRYVVSFQERPGDVFDPIRERLRQGKGRMRKTGPDFLAYALIDVIVDNYFHILETVGDRVEEMDERIVTDPDPAALHEIRALKRETIYLRKAVWPLREVVGGLERLESKLIAKTTRQYLRDVYDHTIQVIDTIEALRDMISGILDIYLSSVSNRMNEVMKVLTIIATIFIPLTFIAGIYGMNFDFMPELRVRWAYPAVWSVMGAVALAMLFYFRRKKWL
ncbi:MAG: magnesium/cobalt transporter CorA [Candidatus Krumholzibacteria bacterium]|nr:magnesium/cobalt transporter CorA [Candidatus Krumholzibacteria bacterium]